jgi:hypothetical protein
MKKGIGSKGMAARGRLLHGSLPGEQGGRTLGLISSLCKGINHITAKDNVNLKRMHIIDAFFKYVDVLQTMLGKTKYRLVCLISNRKFSLELNILDNKRL